MEGQWIFGGREKYNKKNMFMIPVHDRKQNTLISSHPEMDSSRFDNTQQLLEIL